MKECRDMQESHKHGLYIKRTPVIIGFASAFRLQGNVFYYSSHRKMFVQHGRSGFGGGDKRPFTYKVI
jgi:hypothetical protein